MLPTRYYFLLEDDVRLPEAKIDDFKGNLGGNFAVLALFNPERQRTRASQFKDVRAQRAMEQGGSGSPA